MRRNVEGLNQDHQPLEAMGKICGLFCIAHSHSAQAQVFFFCSSPLPTRLGAPGLLDREMSELITLKREVLLKLPVCISDELGDGCLKRRLRCKLHT